MAPSWHLACSGTHDVAFSLTLQDRHTEVVPCSYVLGGSSMAGLRYPSHGRSRQNGLPVRPSAEGRSSWLHFPRKILSFSIPNRFIPAHNVPFCLSPTLVDIVNVYRPPKKLTVCHSCAVFRDAPYWINMCSVFENCFSISIADAINGRPDRTAARYSCMPQPD